MAFNPNPTNKRYLYMFDTKEQYREYDILYPSVSYIKNDKYVEYDLDLPCGFGGNKAEFDVKNFKNETHYTTATDHYNKTLDYDYELRVDGISYGILISGDRVTKQPPYWGVLLKGENLEDFIGKTEEYSIVPFKFGESEEEDPRRQENRLYLHIQGLKGPHTITILKVD